MLQIISSLPWTVLVIIDFSSSLNTIYHRFIVRFPIGLDFTLITPLFQYYRSNSLRANPDKIQVTALYLRNKAAKQSLKVVWNKTELENTPHPKYLGVTLDRTLGYKKHIYNTKMKVATHNNLLRKLSNQNGE